MSGWASDDMFPDPLKNESHKLQILRTANDSLCEHSYEETKVSIDETFQILALERPDIPTESLLASVDAMRCQDSNLGTSAAMKYVSLLSERRALTQSEPFRIESSLMRKHPLSQGNDPSPNVWLYAYGHQAGGERKVIVEFVRYWWSDLEKSENADFELAVESTFERLGRLVELLRQSLKPVGFLSLDCLGASHDD